MYSSSSSDMRSSSNHIPVHLFLNNTKENSNKIVTVVYRHVSGEFTFRYDSRRGEIWQRRWQPRRRHNHDSWRAPHVCVYVCGALCLCVNDEKWQKRRTIHQNLHLLQFIPHRNWADEFRWQIFFHCEPIWIVVSNFVCALLSWALHSLNHVF